MIPVRERLRQQHQMVLGRLVRLLEDQYDLPAAIHIAQRLLRHDPFHEETYRFLMRLHSLNHDRAGALRVYHACVTALERELGVEPSSATRAAYERILAGDALPARLASTTAIAQPSGTVTFLFTDIVDSTRLWEEHPDAMASALARYDAILRQAIHERGGYVFKTVGDRFCAAFASAQEALASALSLMRALQSEAWDAQRLPHPIRIRAGLHTGEAERRDGDYVGSALSRIARLQSAARPGQVLISHVTAALLRDRLPAGVRLHDLGEHHLKDPARPERVFQLVAPGLAQDFPVLRSPGVQLEPSTDSPPVPPALAALTPLVGRQAECAQLQALWQAAAAGSPGLVVLRGEAGIGKSRLAEELLAWAERHGALPARTRSYAAEGRLSYGPVADWLRSEALRNGLARLEPVWLSEVARLLPELLSEHPELAAPQPMTEYWQRQRFFEALARAVLLVPEPLMLLIDDLQWCDPETLEWLHYLLRFDGRARLLMVGTARTEEVDARHPLTALLTDLHRYGQATEIALGPLNADETARLTRHLAGRELGDENLARLYQETEGNPLFVVETLRAGLPEGAGLPQTVQAVIGARLAQLSEPARELAGLAATIGREFTFDVLAWASDRDEAGLVPALDELWQRRIVREQSVNAYDFSHDKLREVAYTELGPARRRRLHRRVAEALEAVHAGDLDPVSAQLAAHYEQAGKVSEAIVSYQRAATVAQRTYAIQETIDLLNRGLALLHSLPESAERNARELELQIALGVPLVAAHGYGAPEVISTYTKVRELCRYLGQPPSPPLLRAMAISHVVRAEFQQAREFGDQLLTLAECDQDPVLIVEAHYVLGVALFWQGALVESRAHLEQAITRYDPGQLATHLALYSQDPRIVSLSRLCIVLWHLGYVDQAVQRSREGLDLGQALGHPFSLSHAMYWNTLLHVLLRDPKSARTLAEEVIAFCVKQQVGMFAQCGLALKNWASIEQGEAGVDLSLLRESADDLAVSVVLEHLRHHALLLLAEQYGKAGEAAEGLRVLTEARTAIESHAAHWCEAELHRVHGDLLLLNGDEAAAEAALQHALAIARTQAARSPELRAATSLARLWLRQGRAQEARDLLAPVYGWFTEGFDIPDLQDARALLDEIGGFENVSLPITPP